MSKKRKEWEKYRKENYQMGGELDQKAIMDIIFDIWKDLEKLTDMVKKVEK